MKIICQTCQSKYTVSDEKVQGKTVKIKCRKCGATILVNSSGAAAAVSSNGANLAEPVSFATGTGEAPVVTYTVNVAEGDQRTMTLAEVIDAYNTSVITAETYVWADGMTDWLPLGQVEPIVAALHAGASQPPAAAPAAAGAPLYGSHVSEPAPAASQPPAAAASQPPAAAAAAVPRVAARRDAGRGARDLFGGGGFGQETQAVADDVATSAPLFSAGVPASAPGSQPPGGTGQRDENSVLFSLSALTAKAGSAAPVTSQTTATKDDSGLIDLRALSAGAPSPTAASLVPDNAALFPLGMPAVAQPIGGMSSSIGLPLEMPQTNRTPVFIGLGAVVALVAVVGAFLFMKGGEDNPVAPVDTAPVAVTTPPPVEPPPPATTEPSASPTATATAVAKGGGRPRGAPKGGAPAAGGAQAAPAGASTGAAAAPAKPKSGGCNCPPGDLMCAMKCSTK